MLTSKGLTKRNNHTPQWVYSHIFHQLAPQVYSHDLSKRCPICLQIWSVLIDKQWMQAGQSLPGSPRSGQRLSPPHWTLVARELPLPKAFRKCISLDCYSCTLPCSLKLWMIGCQPGNCLYFLATNNVCVQYIYTVYSIHISQNWQPLICDSSILFRLLTIPSECGVWTRTNPEKCKPKHAIDSERMSTLNCHWQSLSPQGPHRVHQSTSVPAVLSAHLEATLSVLMYSNVLWVGGHCYYE